MGKRITVAIGFALLGLLSVRIVRPADVTITLNPAKTYQTMTGWEVVDGIMSNSLAFPKPLTRATKDKILERAVNEVGINRIRLEVFAGQENTVDYIGEGWIDNKRPDAEVKCRLAATVNDNSSSNKLNMDGFHFRWLDFKIDEMVLPLRKLLAARGERLYINLTYVAFVNLLESSQCAPYKGRYHHTSGAEYAEFMLAVFTHMREKYDFVPDAIEVILEPDNTSSPFAWRGRQIGEAIVATARKLSQNGFAVPDFITPSNTDMSLVDSYYDEMVHTVPSALQYVSEIAYHRYSGVSAAELGNIVTRAVKARKKTAMLEWWSDSGLTYQLLYADLTEGRNSAWQQNVIDAEDAAALPIFNVNNSNPEQPVIKVGRLTRYTRHFFRYVRFGATRIEATADSAALFPVAWKNVNNSNVLVFYTKGAVGSIRVTGLPAGTYGIWYSTAAVDGGTQSNQTIAAGGTVSTSMPADGVMTIFDVNIFRNMPGSAQNDPEDAPK